MAQNTFDLTITRGEAIRFAILMTHYSRPAEVGQKRVDDAAKVLRRFALACDPCIAPPPVEFIKILSDDLNTPAAIAKMHEYRSMKMGRELWASLRFLGFFCNTSIGPDEIKTLPPGHVCSAEYAGTLSNEDFAA